MCYHSSIKAKDLELEKRFGPKKTKLQDHQPVYHASAYDLPKWPIVREENGTKTLEQLQWGLIPFWVNSEHAAAEIRLKTFNARSETVAEKPSFREAIKSRRCLVPFSGFFEWKTVKSKKYPHYIRLKGQEIGAFAGIYDSWVNRSTGEVFNTFSILTTAANPMMAEIHNSKQRMPVILKPQDENNWIDGALPVSEAVKLLQPYPEEAMEAWTISKLITSRTHSSNVPEVTREMTYPELNPNELF